MGCIWVIYGMYMGYIWVGYVWVVYGLYMDFIIWVVYGLYMDYKPLKKWDAHPSIHGPSQCKLPSKSKNFWTNDPRIGPLSFGADEPLFCLLVRIMLFTLWFPNKTLILLSQQNLHWLLPSRPTIFAADPNESHVNRGLSHQQSIEDLWRSRNNSCCFSLHFAGYFSSFAG